MVRVCGAERMSNIKITWAQVESACAILHHNYIQTHDRNPDCIVALTRGGLVLGTMLSSMFDVPLIPIAYSSEHGTGGKTAKYIPEFLGHIDLAPIDDTLAIYLIDEIADSGHTLKEVEEHYRTVAGYNVTSGTMHHKMGSVFCPTFAWDMLGADAPFVDYPWEMVV